LDAPEEKGVPIARPRIGEDGPLDRHCERSFANHSLVIAKLTRK